LIITGTTQVYAIAADPVAQVRAPEVFNHIFNRHGIDAVMVPMQVGASEVVDWTREFFRARNAGGLILSIPNKSAVLEALARCDTLGSTMGAVNVIRRLPDGSLEGALFDGEGFVLGMEADDLSYKARHALILGAGGAGSAISASLARRGVASITLYDPVPGKAAQVASRVQEAFGVPCSAAATNSPKGFGLVINASPLGLGPRDAFPFDPAQLSPGATVCDILMKNQPTSLLRTVRALGGAAQPGFEMLIQQIPLHLDFFGHVEPARRVQQELGLLRELLYPKALRESWAQA
jgi:shikimate dehydrogenase